MRGRVLAAGHSPQGTLFRAHSSGKRGTLGRSFGPRFLSDPRTQATEDPVGGSCHQEPGNCSASPGCCERAGGAPEISLEKLCELLGRKGDWGLAKQAVSGGVKRDQKEKLQGIGRVISHLNCDRVPAKKRREKCAEKSGRTENRKASDDHSRCKALGELARSEACF